MSKNKIIEQALQKHHDDRWPYEWLLLLSWSLEVCRHDDKSKEELEKLFIKWHSRDIAGIANFDTEEASNVLPT